MLLYFCATIALLLRDVWSNPRKTLLCKGVGVYALMGIAGDLVSEAGGATIDKLYFRNKLADFVPEIDWSNKGPMKGFGGETGAAAALNFLRAHRAKRKLRIISNA